MQHWFALSDPGAEEALVEVMACIEDPVAIQKILDHLKDKAAIANPTPLPRSRAPPGGLFG